MIFRQRRLLPGPAIALSLAAAFLPVGTAPGAASAASGTASRYIVQFAEPALARYDSVASAAGVSAADLIPMKKRANGRLRLDVAGAAARSYVAYLRGRQGRHLDDIAAAIGRVPVAVYSMQHALDAAILVLTPDEAKRVAQVAGVAAVDADRLLAPASDIGPAFTGAKSLWWGDNASPDTIFASGYDARGYLGDGVVIGMIDGGYNSLSPSFQATDANGYRIVNPLGHGVFLGQCDVPGISLGGCNDKVIGVYDEAGLTTTLSNWVYSVEDVAGHGSHTASVAAGDERSASLSGYSAPISGVAPHANLVIYRVCTPVTLCSGTAAAASVDQAIADGVVDVLNFSISDDADPWVDPLAQAFLAATDAGIAVVAAGGNAGVPGPAGSEVNNTAPWITTVAASTHTGGAIVQGARTAVQPDELASFSLPGPAAFDVIKPELQAPGVDIIGATWNDGSAGGADRVAMMHGTSMATAHASGSAALLLGEHPDWTPMEAKSAMMMSAVESGLTKPDGATPSDYFDRGSGRVQEFLAGKAGLVMDENAGDFVAVYSIHGPTGVDTLNLPSMQDSACKNACSFNRTFRSTQDHTVGWNVSVVPGPAPGLSSVSVTPKSFSVGAFASSSLKVSAKTNGLPAGTFYFAKVVMTPDDPQLSPLHLIVAVAQP